MNLLSALCIYFQIMDGVTTFIGLNMFDGFSESNPLVIRFGWPAMIAFKVIVTVYVLWIMRRLGKYRLLQVLTIMAALVVLSNAVQILWAAFG